MKSLSIAATGMLAQQTNVHVIANNIANNNTTVHTPFSPDFQHLPSHNLPPLPTLPPARGALSLHLLTSAGIGVAVASIVAIVILVDN